MTDRQQELLKNLERVEKSIEQLLIYRAEVDASFRMVRGRIRAGKAIRVFLTLRQIDRQLHQLELRRNAVLNCCRYLQARGEYPLARTSLVAGRR